MPDAPKSKFVSVTPNMLVTDLKTSATYYTERLGFSVTMDATEENFVALERDGVAITLLGSKTAAGKSWCSFIVTDPAGLFAEFQAAGATTLRPLETWGDHTEFSIADPDGNRMDIGNAMS